jgi:hypothetical protein
MDEPTDGLGQDGQNLETQQNSQHLAGNIYAQQAESGDQGPGDECPDPPGGIDTATQLSVSPDEGSEILNGRCA